MLNKALNRDIFRLKQASLHKPLNVSRYDASWNMSMIEKKQAT